MKEVPKESTEFSKGTASTLLPIGGLSRESVSWWDAAPEGHRRGCQEGKVTTEYILKDGQNLSPSRQQGVPWMEEHSSWSWLIHLPSSALPAGDLAEQTHLSQLTPVLPPPPPAFLGLSYCRCSVCMGTTAAIPWVVKEWLCPRLSSAPVPGSHSWCCH